jgi:hypothetical protein
MRRRRLLLVVGVVALLGVAGVALLTLLSGPAPTPAVTLENFRLLRHGISERQVEAFLGKPEEASGPTSNTLPVRSGTYSGYLHWRDGNVHISLLFQAGRLWQGQTVLRDPAKNLADDRIVASLRPAEESFLDRIRRLLPW